jgi:acyl carrier protein
MDDATAGDTLAKLQDVFRRTFCRDDLSVVSETSAPDVEGWDSMMHVTLIRNTEKAFGVRFRASEVAGVRNVGQLAQLIRSRQRD